MTTFEQQLDELIQHETQNLAYRERLVIISEEKLEALQRVKDLYQKLVQPETPKRGGKKL